jgi:MFS family permease
MLGVHRLLRIGANPVAGLLFDRRGRRPMFLLGMVLAVLSTLGYAMTPLKKGCDWSPEAEGAIMGHL